MKADRILPYAITLFLVGLIPMASASQGSPLSCGSAKVTVSPARMRGGEQVLQDFLVTVSKSDNSRTFKFSAENDHLQVRCEANRDGVAMLLVNHICGGSSCAESNYSIIDINTYKVLLRAIARQKGNHSAAESILGKKLLPFICGRSQNGQCYAVQYE